MKTFQPKPEHHKFLADLKDQMPADMPDQEILAIAAQFVGQLIALQDQRLMTADAAMELVAKNIEIGNQAAMLSLQSPEGSA